MALPATAIAPDGFPKVLSIRLSENTAAAPHIFGYRPFHPVINPENQRITERLIELLAHWKRLGYRRLHVLLRWEGVPINHKRTYRLYKEAGLTLRKRSKKKRYEKRGMPERTATGPKPWKRRTASALPRLGLEF